MSDQTPATPPRLRRGTPADIEACHNLLWDSVARFPILTLARAPEAVEPGRLAPRALPPDAGSVDAIARIERVVLGFERTEPEAMLLLEHREGYRYLRGDALAGYAFVGAGGSGPVAALDPADLPDILLHIEARAASLGVERLELEVPSPNAVAVRHLLGRGFRIDPWINYLMSNRPFGQFDRFIGFSPPLFLQEARQRLAVPTTRARVRSI